MADNLLTVSALRTTVEAELIRGRLETAGIAAVLVEPEPTAEGAPAGRVQVQVSQADFERAMQVLFPLPKINPAARAAHPAWKCPKCGEQVMGSFPLCWSCGTPRSGTVAEAAAPPAAMPPSGGLLPPPMPPAPPRPAAPLPPTPRIPPSVPPPSAADATLVNPAPKLAIPSAASEPAKNGEAPGKGLTSPGRPRGAPEEADLKIVVPAWDPNTARSGRGSGTPNRREPTDADDRAARRAWWCAVFGLPCPPLFIYSIGVVLILAFSNRPLSARGSRFFYGALALNALIVAAGFVILARLR